MRRMESISTRAPRTESVITSFGPTSYTTMRSRGRAVMGCSFPMGVILLSIVILFMVITEGLLLSMGLPPVIWFTTTPFTLTLGGGKDIVSTWRAMLLALTSEITSVGKTATGLETLGVGPASLTT